MLTSIAVFLLGYYMYYLNNAIKENSSDEENIPTYLDKIPCGYIFREIFIWVNPKPKRHL